MSLGSTAEIETQLLISTNLNYLKDYSILETELTETKKLILGMIRYLNNK